MIGLRSIDISKRFEETMALDSVSLEIPTGELWVLLGPSGCGKTTFLRIAAGLEEADSGELFIGNRRVDRLRPRDRNVALVFQNYSLYPHMTVAGNLAFPLKSTGHKKKEIAARVQEIAGMLGLADRLDSRPGQLSGGQRQRVALGRAIIRKPDLFLLDEPLSNLDADLRSRMRAEIVTLQKQLGVTMLHVTHDQSEALTMADKIIVMNKGRIEQTGSPEQIYRYPATLFVARFLGSPPMNILKARIEGSTLYPFGLSMLNHALGRDLPSLRIGLRPETIKVRPDGKYSGSIISCEYAGHSYLIKLDFQGRELFLAGVPQPMGVGSTVNFGFDDKDLLFFDSESGRNLIQTA